MRPRLLFLENHDSFSHLLADCFWRLGVGCVMVDTYAAYDAFLAMKGYAGIVIGPGPGDEETSPHLMQYVADAVASGVPVLGVCLGMQALGVHFGARLGAAEVPVHGKIRKLVPREGSVLFPEGNIEGIVRYHSLVLRDLPATLACEAASPEGECMALRHARLPIWGVQYHPEAACTEAGPALLARWLQFAGVAGLPLPLNQPAAPPPQKSSMALSPALFC